MFSGVLSFFREVGEYYAVLIVDGEMSNLRIKLKGIKNYNLTP